MTEVLSLRPDLTPGGPLVIRSPRLMLLVFFCLTSVQAVRAADPALVEAVAEYLEFSDYNGGVILPQQIPAAAWSRYFIIDTRDAGQFAQGHIPGAVNIEWRQILARKAEIPTDRPLLLYCNTGTHSSQAGMALRLAGFEQVQVLQEGLQGWKARGGFEANARAAAP